MGSSLVIILKKVTPKSLYQCPSKSFFKKITVNVQEKTTKKMPINAKQRWTIQGDCIFMKFYSTFYYHKLLYIYKRRNQIQSKPISNNSS